MHAHAPLTRGGAYASMGKPHALSCLVQGRVHLDDRALQYALEWADLEYLAMGMLCNPCGHAALALFDTLGLTRVSRSLAVRIETTLLKEDPFDG